MARAKLHTIINSVLNTKQGGADVDYLLSKIRVLTVGNDASRGYVVSDAAPMEKMGSMAVKEVRH